VAAPRQMGDTDVVHRSPATAKTDVEAQGRRRARRRAGAASFRWATSPAAACPSRCPTALEQAC